MADSGNTNTTSGALLTRRDLLVLAASFTAATTLSTLFPRRCRAQSRATSFISDDHIDLLRHEPSQFLAVYSNYGDGTVRKQLGGSHRFDSLSSLGCVAVFAAIAAFDMAPYGDPGRKYPPQSVGLSQLVSSCPRLVCGHYAKLTAYFVLLNFPAVKPPENGADAVSKLHCVVWHDQSFGFHIQLFLTHALDGAAILLDPTLGLVAQVPQADGMIYQEKTAARSIAAGIAANGILPDNVLQLGFRDDPDPSVQKLRANIINKLHTGELGKCQISSDPQFGTIGWDNVIGRMG